MDGWFDARCYRADQAAPSICMVIPLKEARYKKKSTSALPSEAEHRPITQKARGSGKMMVARRRREMALTEQDRQDRLACEDGEARLVFGKINDEEDDGEPMVPPTDLSDGEATSGLASDEEYQVFEEGRLWVPEEEDLPPERIDDEAAAAPRVFIHPDGRWKKFARKFVGPGRSPYQQPMVASAVAATEARRASDGEQRTRRATSVEGRRPHRAPPRV